MRDDPDDRVREKGTFAFSQSKEPEALKDLIGMARHDQSPRVRGQAIFWLAQKGSRKAAEQITDAIENDPETEVKKKAVFALSQMHDTDAVPRLINVAKTNKNPVVRKQAIFWLGQMNDPRALDFLEEILTNSIGNQYLVFSGFWKILAAWKTPKRCGLAANLLSTKYCVTAAGKSGSDNRSGSW